jgi:ABC-2 type transport system ATP-binding protein
MPGQRPGIWRRSYRQARQVPIEELGIEPGVLYLCLMTIDKHVSAPALRTERLGRRYGRAWGLRDCTLEVPAGAVAALVGPNGAGKTTLLEMIIGPLKPTEGQVSVFGQTSRAGTAATLARVGYVAQEHPLYRDFTVADMFRLGRAMNPGWDQQLAAGRMDALGIPLKRKTRRLSGGQQAQVSLTMALAKRAPLLVLDEPVSSLDPVARAEFMRDVTATAADGGLTFLISSHVVAELERYCDWLIILSYGHVQLAGPADDLLAAHRLLTVPGDTPDAELPGTAIDRTDAGQHSTVLVRATAGQLAAHGRPGWQADPVGFEQLIMAYLQRPSAVMTRDDPAPAAHRPGPRTKEDIR